MSKVSVEITVDDIRKLLPSLSAEQILMLDKEIHCYLETHMMMSAASFDGWQDAEEDIYGEQ